jgi:predicted acyl esterase
LEVNRLIRIRIALAFLSFALIPSASWSWPRLSPIAALVQANAPAAAQLEGLAGEYTDASDPGTPLSFYVQDGYKRTGEPVHHVFHDYQRAEVMIPMRDGVKLHVVILKPADIAGPLPFLIQRTPYGATEPTAPRSLPSIRSWRATATSMSAEDIRGRYKSEGEFVMMRPLADHRGPKAIDESTDTYDTVAWLLTNVPGNNGRAGVSSAPAIPAFWP